MCTVSIEGIVRLPCSSALNRARECSNPLLLGPHPSSLKNQNQHEIAAQHLFAARGTSHLLSYRNMFFLVCTRHQLLASSGEKIGHPYLLISESSEKMLSCPAFQSVPHNDDSPREFDDLAALTFSSDLLDEHPELGDRFFPLADESPYPEDDPQDIWVVVGYPSELNEYDIDTDPPTFHRSQATMCGKPTNSGGRSSPGIHAISVFEDSAGGMPFSGNYDGFSGSPAFAAAYQGGDLFYKGVVITGGNQTIRIIHESAVRAFLDALVERFS